MFPELRREDHVDGQIVNTVTCTVKIKIPDPLAPRLASLFGIAQTSVKRMLADRTKSSSKYYPELPSVLSKSLVAKYQRNRKLKAVSRLVLPICGDKGRQIKWDGSAIRIPALFGKAAIPLRLPRPPHADEQGRVNLSGEFFPRQGEWYLSLSYQTAAARAFPPTGMVGVDRNSVGAVATMADPQTGKVFHLGFNPGPTKLVWRNRRRNLQKGGKHRLLARIRRKQARRTRYENHRVSKAIVDYARVHRRAVVLEDLGEVRSKRSKARGYTERSQWSFYQLRQFLRYKAALSGVMVLEVTAAYSSQECSRCHALTRPAGKKFVCLRCGHKDHKDANAAFTLAERVMPTCGLARESESPALGPIGGPLSGNGMR
ncbi:MAG TPA: transposase, partial [Candidatus Dormibacteraeota bacterium]|nr:transposase [Candidatus Dormibacteraeota bacterium]